MPQARKKKVGRPRKVGRPKNVLSRRKVGNGIFDTVLRIGSKVLPFLKDTKIISKGADALGFNTVGSVANTLGLGKKRRVRRRRVGGVLYHSLPYKQELSSRRLGGSLFSDIKGALGVSRGLSGQNLYNLTHM